jgi:hypothetical protein
VSSIADPDADAFCPLALLASHLLADDDRRADEFLGFRLRFRVQ